MKYFIVIGGDLVDTQSTEFRDVKTLDYRGTFTTWNDAHDEWKAASQQNVDNAIRRYFIRPLETL